MTVVLERQQRTLGKGEVQSSNLCGGTTFFPLNYNCLLAFRFILPALVFCVTWLKRAYLAPFKPADRFQNRRCKVQT